MYLDLYQAEKDLIAAHKRQKFSYHEFIKSKFWEAQKLVWYSRHKKVCARCRGTDHINLHHKVYPKAGRYLSLSDNAFVALCRPCHRVYHLRYGVRQNMQATTIHFHKRLAARDKKEETAA